MTLRVLLADDHHLLRSGMRALLESYDDVLVVAEAATGWEVIEQAREHAPDLVLMDISMPELNGLDAMAELKQRMPEVRVVMLSMYNNEEYVLQALRLGAVGYLLKDSAPEELELALRTAQRNETWLSPSVSRQVIEDYLGRLEQADSPLDRLTKRQRQVVQLIAEGYSTRQIAEKLNLSVKTVESHRANLMHRLDLHDVAGIVRFAVRHGLVSGED
jgi:DNA-binding NarL/FixJ family response regulator